MSVDTTSRVQPRDVSINKPLESYVYKLFEQHLDTNLELCIDGKLTAGKIRVLNAKLVGEAWERLKKQKYLIKHLFKKCGLSNNLEGSEGALINIKSIKGYKIHLLENEFQKIEETDSEEDDDKGGINQRGKNWDYVFLFAISLLLTKE